MTTATKPLADTGFHPGELAVQQQAGVGQEAARLFLMLQPAHLSGGFARFLADRTFLVVTGRDGADRLWTTVLTGAPGFLEVCSETAVAVHAEIPTGDPLRALPVHQKLGMTAIEFTTRRRVRLNGILSTSTAGRLVVEVEQAFGNCPQYIRPRRLVTGGTRPDRMNPGAEPVRGGPELEPEEIALIRRADTFFLGTVNPERGADASHRGGSPGFVRADRNGLWWPDYPGNNMFNSLGNLTVNPEAALLFFDFETGRTLHLSGTARLEWGAQGRADDDGHTGRTVAFQLHRFVAGHDGLISRREASINDRRTAEAARRILGPRPAAEHGVDLPIW